VTQMDRLTIGCVSLLAIGIASGFIARAGISVGDLRRKVTDLGQGIKRDLRIGTCMVRAHQLQECQIWIGGAVETALPSRDCYRFEYEVPVKHDSEYEGHKLQAINWVCALKELADNRTGERVYDEKEKVIPQIKKAMADRK
jgi:hypothetical protein